jgi:DNA polymerase I-like protein with 3'-5' exonuclease and polymerase domains
MNIITLDFETYWAQNYTLKKLTTEEYIKSDLFQIIGVGIKVNDAETKWHTGTESQLKRDLAVYDWANSILVCHNTMFDGAILSWVLGIDAHLYADTLSMARALLGTEVGGSLATLANHFSLGVKGTEVMDAKDKRLEDFNEIELSKYGDYCKNDVDLTYDLFNVLIKTFPYSELSLIDMTLRMFIHPMLKIDTTILTDRLYAVQDEKQLMLSALQHKLKCESEEDVRKILASSPKFSKVLEELGVTVPMKENAKGKLIPALAKNDLGFLELLEHENPFVQQLCTVRLGTKSTIEESRLERIIGVGERNNNYLPIPLKYYGAHTGRWSGLDAINMQNLPSRDKKKKALKNSIIAPDEYVVINCDSSQIEARVLAWLAGQEDVVNQFANAEDVYSIFASKIYNRTISKADPVERFVGKTCLAEGTLILTEYGEIPIEKITLEDRVWDGLEWVNHKGLIYQGEKNVITYDGLTATEDHGVFTKQGAIPFGLASSRMEKLVRTGVNGKAIRVSTNYFKQNRTPREEHIRVCKMYKLWNRKMDIERQLITRKNKWMSVMFPNKIKTFKNFRTQVRRNYSKMQQPSKQTLQRLWWTGDQMQFCFEDGVYFMGREKLTTQRLQRGRNRPNRQQWRLFQNKFTFGNQTTTSSKSTQYTICNVEREQNTYFAVERKPLQTNVNTTQIHSSWFNRRRNNTEGVGFGKWQMQKLEGNKRKVRVYDIADAGPRKRYTANGKLVLNCILGLGYGTGAAKLQHTLKTQPPGADLTEDECKDIVKLYRTANNKITDLWKTGDAVIKDLAGDWDKNYDFLTNTTIGKQDYYYGEHKCLKVTKYGIKLPNGMLIRYPKLHLNTEESKSYYAYKSRDGIKSLWGGALVENVVQALARIIVGEQMIIINERYRVCLTVHDAAVCVVKETELEEALEFITGVMSVPPTWAKGLPIACEAGYGKSYGDC